VYGHAYKLTSYRIIEVAGIVAFSLATIMILVVNPSQGVGVVQQIPPSAQIKAYAYAMPNQGWAPLIVYYSAFGSESKSGRIVKYEWDLDANGRYDSNASQQSGYASYIYQKPGKYLVTLKVTDDQGNIATQSIPVLVRHPASSNVDYWTVFDDSSVGRVELRITQANWDSMWQDPNSKKRVKADINIFGDVVESVAVGMKGNASLEGSGLKKSWKIDTDYFVEGQEFNNLKQLLFHNNFADPSLLREKMAYDMMQFAGLPAGFTTYVEFWIDIVDDNQASIYWGVYTMVERVDRKFVANRFGRDGENGNLYKADAWFEEGAADLAYYGEDIQDYPKPRGEVSYGLQTNLDEPDYRDIIHLCYVIDGEKYETPEDFARALDVVFNVDGYLRYVAVIFSNLNLDTYPYTGNNYYIYHNTDSGKFEFIPWDLNNSWGNFAGDARFPFYGMSCCVGPLDWAPLFTKVFEVEQYRQDYAAYVDLLTRHWFNREYFGTKAEAWQEMIDPYLTKETGDKMYFGQTAMYPFDRFSQNRQEIVTLTEQRSEYLRSVLESGEWRSMAPVTPSENTPE